jgi:hypothetical protein
MEPVLRSARAARAVRTRPCQFFTTSIYYHQHLLPAAWSHGDGGGLFNYY